MNKSRIWTTESKKTITWIKRHLGGLAERVRREQYLLFVNKLRPKKNDLVLDVGMSSEEDIRSTNFFEKNYMFSENLTAVTIEDAVKIKKKYPKINVVKTLPNKKLPFKDGHFDIVVSWATLEHVGDYRKQEKFLNELLRIGRKIFITTPYRGCIYEPHSGFFFLHWLPLDYFRNICKATGRKFWSKASNLTPLFAKDIKRMNLIRKVDVRIYNTFKFLPTHIIITSDD